MGDMSLKPWIDPKTVRGDGQEYRNPLFISTSATPRSDILSVPSVAKRRFPGLICEQVKDNILIFNKLHKFPFPLVIN